MDITVLGAVLRFIVDNASNSYLEFDTSRSYEATGGEAVTAGVTLQGVKVRNVITDESQWFGFNGVGIGLGGGLPAGGSMSTDEFPSFGSRILSGAWSPLWVDFDDLVGNGHIFTAGANVIGGASVSIICFGEPWGDPLIARGHMVTEGVTVGGVGAGVMCYKGYWYKTDDE